MNTQYSSPVIKMDKNKDTMNLNNLQVDKQSKDIWEDWKIRSIKSNRVLFEALMIHAVKTGFDPVRCGVKWGTGK